MFNFLIWHMAKNEKKIPLGFKNDIFAVLSAFKKQDQRKLRKLNDKFIEDAVIDFRKSIYEMAVISYVLGKIASKPRFSSKRYGKKFREITGALSRAAKSVSKNDERVILEHLKEVEKSVSSLEKKDERYLTGLISKGRLKVAAIMYAQGVSLGVASSVTGIDKQEIMDYAGKTMMFDRVKEEKSIRERMKKARKLIGG